MATVRVRSFDVFDTVLTRLVARPTDLFQLMGVCRHAGGSFSETEKLGSASFAQRRMEAEILARTTSAREDITLAEIFAQLAQSLAIDANQADALMRLEIDVEKQSVRPVPAIIEQIRQARASGSRIIFVSDMYLPAAVILEMLIACGAYQAGDGLYVSNALGKTKASKNLFRHILVQEQVRADQMLHTGDNLHADMKSARAVGIRAVPFTAAHLNRYEVTLAAGLPVLPPLTCSLLAGSARLTRLACPYTDEHRSVIWNTAADVAGPLLVGYVAWLLRDAQQRGIERLYFLARDGQVLLRLAQIICQKLDIAMECRYLYASRQALHLAAVDAIGDFELGWILDPTYFLSINTILRRIDLVPGEAEPALKAGGIPPDQWNRNLTSTERQSIRRLMQSGVLDQPILARAAQKRELATAYFEQEGLFEPVQYGIVDLGWHGRLQRSLGKVLSLHGNQRPLRGYYFGLLARIGARTGDDYLSYFWDHEQPSGRGAIGLDTRVLMEAFTAADHGGVKEYQAEVNGRIGPVLMGAQNARAVAWGVGIQHEALAEFAGSLSPEVVRSLSAEPGWPELFARVLEKFYSAPSIAEARTFGRFPLAEDQNEIDWQPIARSIPINGLLKAALSRPIARHHNEWAQASKALTRKPLYYGIRLVQKARGALDRNRNGS